MSTMADAEDSLLRAQAKFMEWLDGFMQQWHAPLADTLAGAMWNGIDQPTRDQFAVTNPQAADVMNKNFGGGTNGTNQ